MKDFLLSYDTVCLRPRKSPLKSRDDADTSLKFLGRTFKLPVVPANMADVISVANAEWLSKNGYFYIYHRFGNGHEENEECLNTVYFTKKANHENWPLISISTGVGESSLKEIMTIHALRMRVDFITIDVAHAHHDNIEPMVNFIRNSLPDTKLIVGNVATGDGVEYIARCGADAIKVGIGGGSICTTRYMTGFHLPTLQSVFEANDILNKLNLQIPIIADGGAKHFGDIAKALTFGAVMVMSGGWFASCIDSPAKIVDGKKFYRGSTSLEMKGNHKHIEGRTLELEEGFTYSDRVAQIKDAVTSQISYAGGTDLNTFDFVKWERILPFH
jgi:GMP reductase